MESEKLGAEVRIYTRSRVAGGGGLVIHSADPGGEVRGTEVAVDTRQRELT